MNLRNLRSISLSDSLNDKHKRSPMLITSPQPSVDSGLKVDGGSSVDYDQSRSNFESRESVLRDTDSRSISRVNSSHEYDAGKVKESKMREEAIRTLAQSRQQSSMVPKGSNEFRKSQQSLEPRSIEKQQQQQVDERKIQEERSKSQGETEITTSITKTKIPQETESDGMGGIRIKRPAMSRLVLEQQLQSTDRGKVGMGEIEGGGRRIGDREGREGVNPSMGVGDGCTISSSITLESPYEYKKRQKENANQKMVSMKDLTFGKKENESIGMKSANSMDSIPKKRTKSCHSYTLGGSTPGIGSIGRQGEEDEDGRGGEVITTSKFERHKSPQDSRGREKTTWEYSMECNCVNGVNTSLRTSVKHKRTYLPFACTMYESSV
ncbi:uncharacterized protein LOC128388935 [Panonychus citri]|uniref:uncharacterized protein LOC128388935 n=1 Tax=Panonychus citri TaxID=50023 RepID=UPI0023079A8D|nr:uncharacterized protein LOC128388935 [Panonychus citri]